MLSMVQSSHQTPRPSILPIIIPSSHTSTTTPESFPPSSPSRGNLTWHTLISSPNTTTNSLTCGIAICPPASGFLALHRHAQAEIYYILLGRGLMTIDGLEYEVEKGSTVYIPGNSEHGIANTGEEELRWLYVFATDGFEEVVYRFSDNEAGR